MAAIRRMLCLATVLASFSPLPAQALFYCSEPSEPFIPSGYSASYDSMKRAGSAVEYYAEEVSDYIQCLSSEIEDAKQEYDRVIDEWNRAVNSFNNR